MSKLMVPKEHSDRSDRTGRHRANPHQVASLRMNARSDVSRVTEAAQLVANQVHRAEYRDGTLLDSGLLPIHSQLLPLLHVKIYVYLHLIGSSRRKPTISYATFGITFGMFEKQDFNKSIKQDVR
jgi:hypothetical protein